ncbi:hypothetical protein Ahy_B04g069058 [Arachis hypogaea]|uniref:Uncharacterized protein n=1 Tax=Arachis hypogaea TaxID=3818 RepID=A0A444ZBI2_ARAHY|nr:hypothetical protein Ahy_B04g069058 [Arachis hypogaea]
MAENVFLLVHHRKKIDENTSEGVTFTSKKQVGVFVNLSTSLKDLRNSILQKLGQCGKKHVKQLFFRILISLRQGYVKFGKYEMLGDDDIRVIFHDFQLGAMEFFARMVDVEGSSSGFAPNPPTVGLEGASSAIPIGHDVIVHVSSPSFAADLPVQADNADDLGDVRTFSELAAAIRAAQLGPPSTTPFAAYPTVNCHTYQLPPSPSATFFSVPGTHPPPTPTSLHPTRWSLSSHRSPPLHQALRRQWRLTNEAPLVRSLTFPMQRKL